MNATDSRDYVIAGFAALIERLGAPDKPSYATIIRRNTEARERAQNRVWREYSAVGLLPPSDLALSVTARRELGIGVEYPIQEAAE